MGHIEEGIFIESFKTSLKEYFSTAKFLSFHIVAKLAKVKYYLQNFYAKIGPYEVVFIIKKVKLPLQHSCIIKKSRG